MLETIREYGGERLRDTDEVEVRTRHAEFFSALAESGVNIEMISTSTIRISCVIRSSDVGVAVRAIHDRFHLSEEAEFRHEHPEGTAEIPVVR